MTPRPIRRTATLSAAVLLALALIAPVAGADPGSEATSIDDSLRLETPRTSSAGLQPSSSKLVGGLLEANGPQQVVVRLTQPSVAESVATGAARNANAQRQQERRIEQQQQRLLRTPAARSGTQLGSASKAVNAVMLEVDASQLDDLAASSDVERVAPVVDYERHLSSTVPYVGAAAVQDGDGAPQATGEGVLVAVLDSGIDYTHAALGGPGTDGAYRRAYGPNPESALNRKTNQRYNEPGFRGQRVFPTDKVVAGYDFVGEQWPDGPLRSDPNPIDIEGHGTHVADIVAGEQGVAPGASLVGVKVCASFSGACSGVALIEGMDFALDPFQTGTVDQPVDVINMSLGANYGVAFDDDLSFAVDNASALGVLTVSSAGNGGDKPYISGTPSVAPTALGVAQTALPTDVISLWEIPAGDFPAIFQPWASPQTEAITADTITGASVGNALGCDPFTEDLSGLIVIVDRGECNFTLKATNLSAAGAAIGIIGQVTSEDPFTGGDGGDRPIDIPVYMVGNQARLSIAAATTGGPVETTINPDSGLPLVGTVVGSSSRGPSQDASLLKPEIGAPGASTSAVAGSATDTAAFGGTSGASPMVAGAAALLMELYPDRSWAEIKAVLMNTAETQIYNGAPDLGIGLAPISRIGGGEVRADRAAAATSAAWVDAASGTVGLSFGQVDVDGSAELTRTVTVANYADSVRTFTITPGFRFDDDAALGAASPSAPGSIEVPGGGTATFDLTLAIDGANLPDWNLNSGGLGDNGDALTAMELDGYVTLQADDGESIHVPWHVLPRKVGNVVQTGEFGDGDVAGIVLENQGVGTAVLDAYSLIGTSDPKGEERTPGDGLFPLDLRAAGVQQFPDACGAGDPALVFANSTYERQTHAAAPASFEWQLDVTGDGEADYAVFNFDLAYPALSDGRNVTWALDLATGEASAFFLTAHSAATGFTGLVACGSQVGLAGDAAVDTTVGVDVLAVDFYYRGAVADEIADASFRVGATRTPALGGALPSGASVDFPVIDDGDLGTTESGILLHLGDAPADNEVLVISFDD